jgi:hypothetical protein
MFKVIKTNKVTVSKEFNNLTDLMTYSDKSQYVQGYFELFENGVKNDTVRDGHSLKGFCTTRFLFERYGINKA